MIVGTLLGDAHMESRYKGNTFSLMVEHSMKQKEYVDWKYHEIEDLVRTPPRVKKQMVNGKVYYKYCFRTLALGILRVYHQQFYCTNKKVVPRLIRKWLTPLSLAVWFMDEALIKSRFHRARIINTQGFEKKDIERLIATLKDKYNIAAQLRKQKEGYQIYLLSETIDRFVAIIKPYVISSMSYKLKGLS